MAKKTVQFFTSAVCARIAASHCSGSTFQGIRKEAGMKRGLLDQISWIQNDNKKRWGGTGI